MRPWTAWSGLKPESWLNCKAMRLRPASGLVRVTQTREAVEEATRIGIERQREGYSPEALVLAVDEVLKDMPLSRAIVVYIQSLAGREEETAVERPFSWISSVVAVGFGVLCFWLIFILFRQVGPETHFFAALGIVILQSILVRMAKRGFRLMTFAAVDGVNDASYPTNLHPIRNAPAAVGTLRLRRLRNLMLETADRIAAGESPERIRQELAEVNLTPSAARMLVGLSKMSAFLRDFIPPYQSRWLGLTLAVVFLSTCLIVIEKAGDRLAEGFQLYAIAVSAWIAGDIAARPKPRPPQLPTE